MTRATASTALLAVQTAIYGALTGDAELAAAADVYDQAPEGASFPYVTMGDFLESPGDTLGRNGREVIATFHVWDRSPSFTTCYSIVEQLNQILHETSLAISGWSTSFSRHEFTGPTLIEADNLRHVPVRFRFGVRLVTP